ncbi:DUF4342 domain-containing protein [Candidatus Saccharibacteria bacterium oral taxon 955]|nr:DUF4342 domain-containing protein [Candidatus Saccharibacteria bacterium oral taxon 955]
MLKVWHIVSVRYNGNMTKQKLILTSIATLVVIGGLSLGALLLPTLAALGAAVALMTQCTIAVERRD